VIKKYRNTRNIVRASGLGGLILITPAMKTIIEQKTCKNDKTTAEELHRTPPSRGFPVCRKTVHRYLEDLGQTFRSSVYYQLIHEANKLKRLQ